MQARYPVGSAMGRKPSVSEGRTSRSNKTRDQRQQDESGELGNHGFALPTISGPNDNNNDMDERNITNRRMGEFLSKYSSYLWLIALT
jgi:hypothetical protein